MISVDSQDEVRYEGQRGNEVRGRTFVSCCPSSSPGRALDEANGKVMYQYGKTGGECEEVGYIESTAPVTAYIHDDEFDNLLVL